MRRVVFFLLLLSVSGAFGANRVRCSWLVSLVSFYNARYEMTEAKTNVVQGAPAGDEALQELLAYLPDDIDVLTYQTEYREITPTERIDLGLGAIAAMGQNRDPQKRARPQMLPKFFSTDPRQPKPQDEEWVNARLEIVQGRLRRALDEALKGKQPKNISAAPLIVRGESMLSLTSCMLHDREVGLPAYRDLPRERLRVGGTRCMLSMVLTLPFLYLGSRNAIPMEAVALGSAAGSVPGFVGLWDGAKAVYWELKNWFASDHLDIEPFYLFVLESAFGRSTPGQIFWVYGKGGQGWEVDMVAYVASDGTPSLITLVSRD